MPSNQQLYAYNPWWLRQGARALEHDFHLVQLSEQPVQLSHTIPFRLDVDAVYTLRGPRQTGKTTLLKTVVRGLLETVPPRLVMYADVEGCGITTPHELQSLLEEYLTWARSQEEIEQGPKEARQFLLLDEVTSIKDWGTAIRVLHGRGLLKGVTVIATGSHALDVRRGGESMPGRRGLVNDSDWTLMPLGFRDYIKAHDPELHGDLPEFDLFDSKSVYRAAEEMIAFESKGKALFDRYLETGGFPHAIASAFGHHAIPERVYRLHEQAIRSSMLRSGHREPLFREIVAWASDHRLGREFSWRDISAETELGDKNTARQYIEDAEAAYVWHVVYRAQGINDAAPALRSPKKLYPVDPFTWHALVSWAGIDADPWSASVARLRDPSRKGDMVEAVVATHFKRRFGWLALYYRAPQGQEEIDCVVYQDRQGTPACVEVKYESRITPSDRKWLAKYGGGILATQDTLGWDAVKNVATVPAWALLAGYAEPVTLYPAKD